jgi:hypothetical protein
MRGQTKEIHEVFQDNQLTAQERSKLNTPEYKQSANHYTATIGKKKGKG